jgi:predicted nucleic acid-binding protein
VILLDSNIPMYLVGTAHPHKADAERLVAASLERGDRLVTDVEVLQEILHRYSALNRHDMIQPAFDAILGLVDEVFPIDVVDAERAKGVVLERRCSARDALHVAIMQRRKIQRIMSFDRIFDEIPDITRIC